MRDPSALSTSVDKAKMLMHEQMLTTLVVTLAVCAALPTVLAQSQPTLQLEAGSPLENHLHERFGIKSRLPSAWIRTAIQSRDGYIWVGTDNGLARFDGKHFTTFNTRNTAALPGNNTRVLFEADDGRMWIGGTLGLSRYQPGRPGTFETIEELRGKNVRAILQGSTGDFWIGTSDGLWRSQAGDTFRPVKSAPKEVRSLAEDHQGTLWVGTDWGLFRHTDPHFERATKEGWNPIPSLLADPTGLWVGTSFGIARYENGRLDLRKRDGLPSDRVREIKRARDGAIYLTFSTGIGRIQGERTEFSPSTHPGTVHTLLEDREGGLWVGLLASHGLHHYRRPKTGAVLKGSTVFCVLEDQGGIIWFGTNEGLVKLEDGKFTEFGSETKPHHILSLAEGRDGSLLIGGISGIARLTGEDWQPIDRPPELMRVKVQTLFEDSRGALWIGRRSDGTVVVRDGVVSKFEELGHGIANWFWEDDEGMVWLGTDYGIYRGTADHMERVIDPQLERLSPHMTDHYVTPDGDRWIATLSGLARYRDGRFTVFTARDGLAAEYIERLGSDNHGNLWMGGPNGFFYVSLQELDDFAAGQIDTLESHSTPDDLGLSSEQEAFGFPHTCLSQSGTLYLASKRGVLTVPPTPFPKNTVPPELQIESAVLDGNELDANQPFTYSSGNHRLSIRFAAPSFTNPKEVRVWYRLEGHNKDWIEAGSESTAHFTELTPGRYSFHLKAENEDGVHTAGMAPLLFRVAPRWFEMLWLRMLAVTGFVFLVGLYFRARTRTIRRHNRALQREIVERQRAENESHQHWEDLARVSRAATMGELATSIAHEVKQPLFAVVSNAQTAGRLLDAETPDVTELREALNDIASDGNRASSIVDHVRAMVRKDHKPSDHLDLNDVARMAVELAESETDKRSLILKVDLAEDLPLIRGDSIELQQVVLNLLINGAQAMKDVAAGSRVLNLRTVARNGAVELSVEDGGVGVEGDDLEFLFKPFYTTKANGTGMGLAINNTIIEAHGGRIWAERNPDCGMTFSFRLPSRSDG
ncbi:two-component regulator propeller domain-containing protein [Haloferula sp.]|uniref:two-component regulator propeller domain-containing protein n=1 Tax=Haloferula sp. TaxID=2497595 RepID=UPI00329DEACA